MSNTVYLPPSLTDREFLVLKYESINELGGGRLLLILDDRSSFDLGSFMYWEIPGRNPDGSIKMASRDYLVRALGNKPLLVDEFASCAFSFGLAMLNPATERVSPVRAIDPVADEKALVKKMFSDEDGGDVFGSDRASGIIIEHQSVGQTIPHGIGAKSTGMRARMSPGSSPRRKK